MYEDCPFCGGVGSVLWSVEPICGRCEGAGYVDPAARAAEKQADREADWADIHEGRRTAEQVSRENALASGLMHMFRPRRERGVR